jgi:spore coat polysaccharide biosynthesis protein SpsF
VKLTAVIQARMGSTRLPGKILMKINGNTLLQCQLEQLEHSSSLNDIIIATTTNPEDDMIVDFANTNAIKTFRGNSLDVLDRYYQCARHFSLEHIMRITSDCPLIDPTIVDKTAEFYKVGKFDYVNNFHGDAYPPGTDVEVFSTKTLKKTWEKAKKPSEREHVTPYIYNNPTLFSIGYLKNTVNVSGLHYAVDREEDLQLVKLLYKKIQRRPILLDDIIKAIKEDPTMLEINKNTSAKEGYLKSLENDKTSSNK